MVWNLNLTNGKMSRIVKYTCQCTHPETGKTGCWLFDGDSHRKPGTTLSPVFPDLMNLYDWLGKQGSYKHNDPGSWSLTLSNTFPPLPLIDYAESKP